MLAEEVLCKVICDTGIRVNLEMPYPLDAETAAVVEAAVRHHLTTWEQLKADGTVEDWLYDYLVSQGATELPEDGCEYHDGKWYPTVNEINEKEVRACFKEETEFEKFRSGMDYSHGLASITDAEFSAHYEQIVAAIQELVDSGQVKAGVVLNLESVPIPFLMEVPLADGVWLDRHVLELAEGGALLQHRGYQMKEGEYQHPLAQERFTRNDGKEIDQAETQVLKRQVVRHLRKFTGRKKKIDGRLYINFEDYHTWPGRKVRGDLKAGVKKGLVTAAWNSWVDAHGGDDVALVASVPVVRLQCCVDECSYQICSNVNEQLRRRGQLLESLRIWQSKPERKAEQLRDWKDIAEVFLADLFAFQDALAFIGKHYFDGHQILFPDLDRYLADLVEETGELVGMFNDSCAEEAEQNYLIDLEEVRKGASEKATEQTAFLVDMAKAEALDAMGEPRVARELAERHLGSLVGNSGVS
jgi:hypothetical protein